MLDTPVGDDDELGLLEGMGGVVGEVTARETTRDRLTYLRLLRCGPVALALAVGVCRELQDRTLPVTVRAGRNEF